MTNYSYLDYVTLGEKHDLLYLESAPAPRSIDRVPWFDKITGQHFIRSFNLVATQAEASTSRTFMNTHLAQFSSVAQELGIQFVYEGPTDPAYFPQSTRHPARWIGKNGRVVWLPYHNLAYGEVRLRHHDRVWLGIDYEYGQVVDQFFHLTTTLSAEAQYRTLGKQKAVRLVDMRGCQTDDDPVLWLCERTYAIFTASYNQVAHPAFLSPGMQYKIKHELTYLDTASRHGIYFDYRGERDIFPQSHGHPARWRTPGGNIFYAKLNEMDKPTHKVKSSLRKYLRAPDRVR